MGREPVIAFWSGISSNYTREGGQVRRANDWAAKFGKCQVLVVGDLMLDDYRRGHVERISPEAPIPILSIVATESTLGGAANVVRNLRALEVDVSVVGVLGEDKTGQRIAAELAAIGVGLDGIIRDRQRVSTRKIRYVSMEHGQQVFRADEETSRPVTGNVESEIVRRLKELARSAQIILCSDYDKGVLSEAVLQASFEAGRAQQIPVLVAPKDSNPNKYEGASILMPNLKELANLLGTPVGDDAWLTESANALIASHKLEALVVTRGGAGMSLFQASGGQVRRLDIPTVARQVYDVTGAGDTAIAVLGAAVAAGLDREAAVHLANAAAGIVVGKHGTATVTLRELQDYLTEQGLHAGRMAQPLETN